MIDVEKLNNTIIDLENEVVNIKSISNIVDELDKLSDKSGYNQKMCEEILTKLTIAKDCLVKAISAYEHATMNMNKAIVDNGKSFDSKIQEIKNENYLFNKELHKSYKNMENELLTQIQEIRTESKKLYLEFEDILSSKLDRSKSDIEIEVRNRSIEIVKYTDNIVKTKVDELKKEIETINNEINEKMKNHNNLLFLLIGLAVVNIILRII